jgi:CRP/FNR family transcriptional regulator, polysaccharide utilization system transcription regulator
MRYLTYENCQTCKLKCDIFFTAREIGIEKELKTAHIVYKKHETICRQNTEITHAIILLEGNAKMYIDGVNNKNIILNILLPSNYIGLLSVYGTDTYTYSVEAINSCQTCHVDINLVKKMYYQNHNFLLKLNKAFGATVSNIMQKLISLNQKQIRGKVAESLLYLSQLYEASTFELNITRKELGELSAISEENAVRVLTEFKNEGIIGMEGKEICLLMPEMLKKISAFG